MQEKAESALKLVEWLTRSSIGQTLNRLSRGRIKTGAREQKAISRHCDCAERRGQSGSNHKVCSQDRAKNTRRVIHKYRTSFHHPFISGSFAAKAKKSKSQLLDV